MKVRIEVPILLYADIELPTDAIKDGQLSEVGKSRVFHLLERALGEVGEEPIQPACTVELPRFANARIYLTDHLFPVHSWDGLSLTSEDRDTPHADD